MIIVNKDWKQVRVGAMWICEFPSEGTASAKALRQEPCMSEKQGGGLCGYDRVNNGEASRGGLRAIGGRDRSKKAKLMEDLVGYSVGLDF